MKKSLFSKIFFTQITVTLIVLLIVVPSIFILIGDFFIESNKEDVLQDATRVAALTAQFADVEGGKETREFFKNGIEFAGGQSIILVTDALGKVLFLPNDPSGVVNEEKINKKFIESVMSGYSSVKLYKKNSIFSQQTIAAIVPVIKSNPVTGESLFLGTAIALRPMPLIRDIQNRLLTIIFGAQIISWVVAFVVSFFLTRQILKPVKKMRTAAKSIASGNFNERIPVTSGDEIGQLAESFNSMTVSLNELENMRSSFVSDVSHELRTPMTTISGFVEGVLDGTIPDQDRSRYLSTVLSETKRLSKLVNDLLDSTRLEQGKIKIEKKSIDMNRLVAESAFSYEQQLLEKKINVNLELEGEECFAYADKDSIKRVLINLLDNAIKFTPEGGDIFIETKIVSKKVYVSIQNSGEGISKDDLRHIWERFYKTDKSRSEDKKGVGLGLHIVKTIISQHGGEIFVESEVGQFTKFTFVLDTAGKNS